MSGRNQVVVAVALLPGILIAAIGAWYFGSHGKTTRDVKAREHTEVILPAPPRGTATIVGSVELNGAPIYPMMQNLIWLDPHRPGKAITLDSLEVAPDGTFRAERVPAGTVRLTLGTGLLPLVLPAGCSATKELHVHAQETYDVPITFMTSANAVTFEVGDADARQFGGGELVASVVDGDYLYGAHPFWRHRTSNVLDPRVFSFQGVSGHGLATASLLAPSRTTGGTLHQGLLEGRPQRFSIDATAIRVVTGTVSNAGRETSIALFPGVYRWPGHGVFAADQYLVGAPLLRIQQSNRFVFDCVAPGTYTLVAETLVNPGDAPGLEYAYFELPVEVGATPVMVAVVFPD